MGTRAHCSSRHKLPRLQSLSFLLIWPKAILVRNFNKIPDFRLHFRIKLEFDFTFTTAVLSAQMVSPKETFSMLHPCTTVPSVQRSAAPTANLL